MLQIFQTSDGIRNKKSKLQADVVSHNSYDDQPLT